MADFTSLWAEFTERQRLRETDPRTSCAEFLREHGYIVEKADTLSLPVQVARSGRFDLPHGIKLHTRVTVGDQKLQIDYAISAPPHARAVDSISSVMARKFSDSIAQTILPEISSQVADAVSAALKEAALD